MTLSKNNKQFRYLIIILGIIVLIKLLETMTPFSHADSLYYGMVIGKNLSWQTMKESYLTVCGSFQSGLIEFLQAYPISKMGGNIWTQITMQAMHFIFGQLLAGYILYKNIEDKRVAVIAFIAALTISVESDFFLYSKTDGYLASIGLLTFITIQKRKGPYIIGVLLGLIPLIKLSGLLITAPLSLYYVYSSRDIKAITRAAVIALGLTSIILIRNYVFMGTPFYPALLNVFPGEVSQTPREYYLAALSAPINREVLTRLLKDFFVGKIIFLFIPYFIFKNKLKNIEIYVVSLSIFLLYVFINGGVSASRFFFVCLFLNVLYLAKNLSYEKIGPKYIFLVMILISIDSKIDKSLKRDVQNIKHVVSGKYGQYRKEKIPLSVFWDYIPAGSKVLSDEFSQQFYSPERIELVFGQCNQKFEKYRNCTDDGYKEINSFDFAILTGKLKNRCFNKLSSKQILYEKSNYKLYKLR